MPSVSSRRPCATPAVRSTRAANRIANHLIGIGVRPGERVGIYSRNRAEYVEALFGCWKCGAVPVNVNWRYVADELRYVIDDAEFVAMIVEDEYLPVLDDLGFDRRVRMGDWDERERRSAPSPTSRARPTTSTCSTRAAPPGCPRA